MTLNRIITIVIYYLLLSKFNIYNILVYYYFVKYIRANNEKIICIIGIRRIQNYLYIILDKTNYIFVGFCLYFIISDH
jgi:hypothetical protein